MNSDAVAIAAVVSWTYGLLALAAIGVVAPLVTSFLPDAVILTSQ